MRAVETRGHRPAFSRWVSPRSAAALFAALGVVVLAVAAAFQLADICAAGHGLPMWDPAEHGLAGVTLARAVRRGDLLEFLLAVNRQVLWPFVHSLLLAPWVLAFGDAYATTDRLSSVLFAGTVIATFAAGLSLHARRGAWVGCGAAALVLLAPHYRLYGTLTMLEMPGAFLLALTLCFHLRAARDPAPPKLLVAAGVSTTALALCKYNYGLLWLSPLALYEWLAATAEDRAAWIGRAWALVRSGGWRRPFPLVMLAYGLLILGILATGGGAFALGGRHLSVRSVGNPAYGFYVLVVLWAILRLRQAGGWGAVARRLSPRHAILVATVALPLAIWFLVPYPNRVRALVGFVVNRDSGTPLLSWETLLYYPQVFVQEYSPAPLVGWIVLALALLSPWRRDAASGASRMLFLALWVGLIATAAHHYRQPRFLFTTALLVWLSAAQNAVRLLDRALARISPPAWIREPTWAIGLVALLAWAWVWAPAQRKTLADHVAFQSLPVFAPVLDRVIAHAARAEGPGVLLGYSNWMSPALVRWHALRTRPALGEGRLPEAPGALPVAPTTAEIAGRIESLRRSGRPVLVALPLTTFPGETADYREETRADSMTAARLASDPGVRVEREDLLPSGFRVVTFRFAAPVARAVPGR